MEQGLAPSLKNNGLDIGKTGNELAEVAQSHITLFPIAETLPYAHPAGKRASRGDLDLPGEKSLSSKRREQFL